jgi:hypothetical protein
MVAMGLVFKYLHLQKMEISFAKMIPKQNQRTLENRIVPIGYR